MKKLLKKIKQCNLCINELPLSPKPILQASKHSKILIVGQAPGIVTHEKWIPFDDLSGDRLRKWLGINRDEFYNENLFAIIPMGFCYPGTGKSGDLPPIKKCAETWRVQLLNQLTQLELTIILGKYAINWHLSSKAPITELAKQWENQLNNKHIVLPHPSPRNNIWLKKNEWFEQDVIPVLQQEIKRILNTKE